MSLLALFLVAVGLSMDALAVAMASGLAVRRMRVRQALRMALFFGLFQALMPMIGWLAGLTLRTFIARWDHWVAFGLLVFIGGKMIVESFRLRDTTRAAGPISLSMLLLLSVATSIDALAVGLSLSLLQVLIVSPALLIGAVTFLLSLLGGLIGSRVGHCCGNRIEALGSLILIGIGVKILLDHLG